MPSDFARGLSPPSAATHEMWLLRDAGARSLANGAGFGIGALALDVAAVLVSNSAALRADLVRGGADTAAAVFALLIYIIARAPNRPERVRLDALKWENLSGLATGCAILIGIACVLSLLAVRLADPVIIRGTTLGFVVAMLNLVCNIWLLALNRKARTAGRSPVIDAQAGVIRTKLCANLTLFAAIGGATFAPDAALRFASDGVGVITQSAFSCWTAIKLLRRHARLLRAFDK